MAEHRQPTGRGPAPGSGSPAAGASTPNAQTLLPEDDDVCIELYFELDTPAQRDVFWQHFGQRNSPSATAFLHAALQQDPDPFVRLSAARALAERGSQEGIAALREQLAIALEDDLLAEAIAAWQTVMGPAAWPEVHAIYVDVDRSPKERLAAQMALSRLDGARARDLFLLALEQGAGTLPDLEALMAMVPMLGEEESVRCRALSLLREHLLAAEAAAQQAAAEAESAGDEQAAELLVDAVDDARERVEAVLDCLALLSAASDAA